MTFRDEKPAHPQAHLAFPFSKAVEYQTNIFRATQDLEAFFDAICNVQDKNANLPFFTCEPCSTPKMNEQKGFWLRWSSSALPHISHETKVTIFGSGRLHLEINQKKGTLQCLPNMTSYDLDPEKQPAELTARMINMVTSAHPDIQNLVRRNQQAFLDEIGSHMIVQPLGDPKPPLVSSGLRQG